MITFYHPSQAEPVTLRALEHSSPSQVRMMRRCARRWYLRYIRGLKMDETLGPFMGTLLHVILEVWLVTGVVINVGDLAKWGVNFKPGMTLGMDERFTPELAHRAIKLAQLGFPYLPPGGTVPRTRVERRFSLDTGLGIPIIGAIDLLTGTVDSQWQITDFKSTKDATRWMVPAEQLYADPQAIVYGREVFSKSGKQTVSFRHLYFDTTKLKVHDDSQIIMHRDDNAEKWLGVVNIVKDQVAFSKVEDEKLIPYNRAACGDFGGCAFRERCAANGVRQMGFFDKNKGKVAQGGAPQTINAQPAQAPQYAQPAQTYQAPAQAPQYAPPAPPPQYQAPPPQTYAAATHYAQQGPTYQAPPPAAPQHDERTALIAMLAGRGMQMDTLTRATMVELQLWAAQAQQPINPPDGTPHGIAGQPQTGKPMHAAPQPQVQQYMIEGEPVSNVKIGKLREFLAHQVFRCTPEQIQTAAKSIGWKIGEIRDEINRIMAGGDPNASPLAAPLQNPGNYTAQPGTDDDEGSGGASDGPFLFVDCVPDFEHIRADEWAWEIIAKVQSTPIPDYNNQVFASYLAIPFNRGPGIVASEIAAAVASGKLALPENMVIDTKCGFGHALIEALAPRMAGIVRGMNR